MRIRIKKKYDFYVLTFGFINTGSLDLTFGFTISTSFDNFLLIECRFYLFAQFNERLYFYSNLKYYLCYFGCYRGVRRFFLYSYAGLLHELIPIYLLINEYNNLLNLFLTISFLLSSSPSSQLANGVFVLRKEDFVYMECKIDQRID